MAFPARLTPRGPGMAARPGLRGGSPVANWPVAATRSPIGGYAVELAEAIALGTVTS